MAQDPFNINKFRRPELIFQDILRKGAQGLFVERSELTPLLQRALVLGVDVDGGKLENPQGSGNISHEINGNTINIKARLGPENPPNSIKARIISNGQDKFSSDSTLKVFWPFFPEGISVPIKPGEHVYVLFEDTEMQHGLWISKIPGHVGSNYTPGEDFFKPADSKVLANKFDDTAAVSSEEKKYDKNMDAAETKSGNTLSSLTWKKG